MNKKQLMIERAMPIVMILVSIYVIVKSQAMGSEGVFPTMSAAVLLISSIYIMGETIMKKKQVVKLEGVNLPMVGVTLLALVVYVLLLKKIGYILDTFILCAFIMRALGYKKYPIIIVCSLAAVLAVFVIFKVLLSVPLPMILLDF